MTHRARNLRVTSTPAEQRLWQLLRNRRLSGAKFRRQQPVGPYIVDFFCSEASLVIELDGARHYPTPAADLIRDAWLTATGLTVLRFENRQVFEALADVMARIQSCLPPSPSGRGPG